MTESRSSMLETVRKITDQQLKLSQHGYELAPKDDLWGLGMSSLNSLGLMLAIEDALDFEFPENLLNEGTFRSVEAIAAAVESVRKE